ncbi:MAG: hypothetical protein GY742_18230 [Hyphomicrobiales bacterium]|nr:hypothetical protein [Hyphomicrobiales bacterium]
MTKDWFEVLTGFPERNSETVRENLSVDGSSLCSEVNGKTYSIGSFQCITLEELRKETATLIADQGTSSCELIIGDVKKLHEENSNKESVFQVASQFNCLEMISPNVTPEDGVTRYQHDRTQGPACAISAGAATIYRNYFVPLGEGYGQTSDRQINTLKPFADALAKNLGCNVSELWFMKNGYLLLNEMSLSKIDQHLLECNEAQLDAYRKLIQIGIHWDVEVTSASTTHNQLVSQVFCSALPVAYNHATRQNWARFARLVLEGTYEATMLAAVVNRNKTAVETLFLTLLGGGAFGNEEAWITSAIQRAIEITRNAGLDIKIVCFSEPSAALTSFVSRQLQ